jgi:hypothetical protein
MDRIERPRSLPEIVFRPDVRILEAQLSDHDRWRPLTGSGPPDGELVRLAVATACFGPGLPGAPRECT